MLGHDIAFSYCRAPASRLPCGRILDCWWETFDIEGFIRRHYSPQDIEAILAPRKDKMLTLVELIERAKKTAKDSSDPNA
jgi:hypothetical protein